MRGIATRNHPAKPAEGVCDAQDSSAPIVDRDFAIRDDAHSTAGRRSSALARLDGRPVGDLGQRPLLLRRFDGRPRAPRRSPASCKPMRDLSTCRSCASSTNPAFSIGSAAEAFGHDPLRRRCHRRRHGVHCAVGFGHRTQVLWRRRGRPLWSAGHDLFSWPSAESGALPIEGGVAVAFRREIAAGRPTPKRCVANSKNVSRHGAIPFPQRGILWCPGPPRPAAARGRRSASG